MLDVRTRQRIDTARDILVGKVPDPKSQVEQITLALMYKFMDDMDALSESFEGGKASFFVGEFGRYSWRKVVGRGIGAFDALNLYSEGITRMGENPGLPVLFRSIFNNAYLPFRDPETLRAFLGVIDEFEYDNSERLGDAFEYLLSIMGSQGDAGQFRTPRHIIDFIVEIVDPKKDDVILDPACGTAGFLISAYKHVGETYMDGRDGGDGVGLSGEERARLARNVRGYDISPDMVRLSLVNLYLHGFPDPDIFEYDTLTSEERWGEYANVILANPPFMSPKGGIRPHNRFSVTSRRSEVLFVDYIAEHLTADGRAGVIVPEGIIFQSQNAYKQLRKMLVEEYLVAVVSLPPGVFNPYSGVKTSVLILDKALARRAETIGFFKVENDGFDLGAQRRPIDRNDLPAVKGEVVEYLRRVREGIYMDGGDERDVSYEFETGLVVEKERVGADGEFNLSGERYRTIGLHSTAYPLVALGEVCSLIRGVTYKKGDEVHEGGKQVLRANNISKDHSTLDFSEIKRVGDWLNFDVEKRLSKHDIFICLASGSKDHIGKVAFISDDTDYFFGGFMGAIRSNTELIDPCYLFSQLRDGRFNQFLRDQISGANINNLGAKLLYRYEIPLPPLEVQREIVSEIEGYQRVIDGARAVVENWRPRIAVDPGWPVVELGEVCERVQYGLSSRLNTGGLGYRTFRMNELVEGRCSDSGEMKFADVSCEDFEKYRLNKGDILFNRTNSYEHVGRTGIFDLDGDYCFASYLIRLSISSENALPFYVNAYMNTNAFQSGIKRFATRAIGQSNVNAKSLAAYPIPLPPLTDQRRVVAEIESERGLVDANRQLIERMEGKVRDVVGRVWGQ